jgi:hypothetical protein
MLKLAAPAMGHRKADLLTISPIVRDQKLENVYPRVLYWRGAGIAG